MLGEFFINIKTVKKSAYEYKNMYQEIQRCNEVIAKVSANLPGHSYGNVRSTLSALMEDNRKNIQGLKMMEKTLLSIVMLYENAEDRILTVQLEHVSITFGDESSGDGSDSSKDDDGSVWDYILEALEQAVLGDFSDKSNLLGITLSVLLGFVPIVGQVCDVRDLIADIYNLFDDGPETSEWVALGFTIVGFIPGLGDFCKHGDDLAPLLRNLDDIADGLGDAVKGIIKKGDEVFSAAEKYIDKFNEIMDDKIYSKVADKIDDFVAEMPNGHQVKEIVEDIIGKEIDYIDSTVGDVLKEWGKEIGLDKVQGWISDGIDWITGNDNDDVGDASVGSGSFACAV